MAIDAPPCIAKNHVLIKGGKVCMICWWAPLAPAPWPKNAGPKPRHRKKSATERVFAYWGDRCVYCSGPASTRDHVIPRSRGGSNGLDNLRPCCRGCNNKKADQTPFEWLGDRCPEQFRSWVAPESRVPQPPPKPKPEKPLNSQRVKEPLMQPLSEVWPEWMTPDNADF